MNNIKHGIDKLDIVENPSIPKEFLRLNITQAYELMGIPRSTFNYKHLSEKTSRLEDKLSLCMDENGNKYIDATEMRRVFKDAFLERVKEAIEHPIKSEIKHTQTSNLDIEHPIKSLTFQEELELKFELKEAKKDLERERERLKFLENTLSEERRRVIEAEARAEKYYSDLTGSMRLLENKSQTIDQLIAEQSNLKKPWWKKIF